MLHRHIQHKMAKTEEILIGNHKWTNRCYVFLGQFITRSNLVMVSITFLFSLFFIFFTQNGKRIRGRKIQVMDCCSDSMKRTEIQCQIVNKSLVHDIIDTFISEANHLNFRIEHAKMCKQFHILIVSKLSRRNVNEWWLKNKVVNRKRWIKGLKFLHWLVSMFIKLKLNFSHSAYFYQVKSEEKQNDYGNSH